MDEEAVDYFLDPPEQRLVSTIEAPSTPQYLTLGARLSHMACQQSLIEAMKGIMSTDEGSYNEPPEEDMEYTASSPALQPLTRISRGLYESMAPTAEQQLQYRLSGMYELSHFLIERSNPKPASWPARIDGWPAQVTKEAYAYQPYGPQGPTVYARLALFSPARNFVGAEEPCVITTLDPTELYDIKSCGNNRRGVVATFYHSGDKQLMLLSESGNHAAYTANDPDDIKFVATVLCDMHQQIVNTLKTKAYRTLDTLKAELAIKAGIPSEEAELIPENITDITYRTTYSDGKEVARPSGSIHNGRYYDARGNELTLDEFLPYHIDAIPLIFKSVRRRN